MKMIKKLSIISGVVLASIAFTSPSIMAQLNEEVEQPMEQQNTEPVNDLVEKTFKRAREYDR